MATATSPRTDSAIGYYTTTGFSQVPYDPFAPPLVKTPPYSQFRFLDIHPLFQRKQRPPTPPHSLQSLSPRNSSQDTVRPAGANAGATSPTPSSHRLDPITTKPRHVPITISQGIINSVLKIRPPSPISPVSASRPESALYSWLPKEPPIPLQPSARPRHVPIEIPAFAHPFTHFPPTPSSSAKSTPRGSFKTQYSCEHFIRDMSRPPTSGSRTSTLDSSVYNPGVKSPPDDRAKPISSTYTGEMNSGSESSLNQVPQDGPTHGDHTGALRSEEYAPKPSTNSPPPGNQVMSTQVNNSATNLSGLVCNVHRCTGREPHGLVGATTTILRDKLYVFGGRILSRKRPYLSSDMFELDLIRRHWTKLQVSGDIPAPRYFHSVCALGDNKLICYGGMSPAQITKPGGNPQQANTEPNGEMSVMSDIHVFDAARRLWTHITTSDTPPGRYAHCAAVLPSTATFTSANAPMSALLHNPPSANPNQGSLGVAIDGAGGAEMIVVGGQDKNNKYIDAISVFNLRSLKWTDTQSLPRSCGAYRSVVTPLVGMPPARIGAGTEHEVDGEGNSSGNEKADSSSSMLIYSNYNFLDVKLELQVRMPNGSLVEKPMKGPVSPPGLRFPNGDVLDNHFIVSGTYLTSSKHEYALWALDLRTMEWSRIDAGGSIFSQGSWNRGVLWARRNTFVILGNRKRSLVDDYNHRRINFSNICMVELEAFGLYDNPRRTRPSSNYTSISSAVLGNGVSSKSSSLGGRPLVAAAVDLGTMAMNIRDLADMDLLAIGGERIPVNSHILARRWGPYFIKLLKDSGVSTVALQNDASSSSDGGTLRANHLNAASMTSRNSSITITPSVATVQSIAPSSVTAVSNTSNSTITGSTSQFEPPSSQNLPPGTRPRQLYLPHTLLTLRALVHFLYTSSLPAPNHHLCTPQILCSLLQLARPYRIDGLLEATVERLHQLLDGRNAAAVFNAAAMASGGGRGTGTAFGKEGLLEQDVAEDLTLTRLQARIGTGASGTAATAANGSTDEVAAGGDPNSANASESEPDDGASDMSSSVASSSSSIASDSHVPAATKKRDAGGAVDGEIWSGGLSCVVGLQKRGLRGLMEGRRIREKERGGSGSKGSGLPNGSGAGGGGVNGVGLGIA